MGLFSGLTNTINKTLNDLPFVGSFSGKYQQDDANEKAMQAWNLANNYNHPIQQMERLKAAGLNPLLVYGSGSVSGNTSGAPALQGGGISSGLETLVKVGGKALSAMQGMATLDQTYATTAAQHAAAGASGAQAANLNAQAALNQTRNKYEQKSLIADIDYKTAIANKTRAETVKAAAEARMAKAEADLIAPVGGKSGAKVLGGLASMFLKGR